MAVAVNTKICDNASECGGIEVCPTGALFWDSMEERIGIDNNLCIACRQCEGECPVGAILVADSDEEYGEIQKNIENDPRTAEELFVERYGAMLIDDTNLLEESDMGNFVENSRLIFIESFNDDSIQCLLHSIPVSEILKRFGGIYRKVQVKEKGNELPCLTIYENGKLVGCVEGYYEDNQKEELFHIIKQYIKE